MNAEVHDPQMDAVLRDHARRWVGRQPPPPPLDLVSAPTPTRVRRVTSSAGRSRLTTARAAAAAMIAVLAIVGAVFGARGLFERDTNDAGVPAFTLQQLVRVARAEAQSNNVADPHADAVRTTYGRAERVVNDGDTVSSPAADAMVWVIQMRGNFTCTECSTPEGASTPTGTVLTLILIHKTLQQTEFTLGKTSHDLSKLGRVVHLAT